MLKKKKKMIENTHPNRICTKLFQFKSGYSNHYIQSMGLQIFLQHNHRNETEERMSSIIRWDVLSHSLP